MRKLGGSSRRSLLVGLALLLASGLTVLVAGAAGAGSDPRVVAVGELDLYDARGKLVGGVTDVNGTNAVVVVRVGKTLVALSASPTRLGEHGNTISTPLLYESTDCTGQAFEGTGGAGDPDGLFPLVFINGTKLYAPTADLREHTVNSALNQEGTDCAQLQFSSTDRPVQELADLASTFRAPFTLRWK